jgi:hypothetical protein
MVRRVAAGLAGLGLVGGVGAVTYNDDGSTTVKITDKNGKVQTVNIEGDGGKTFSCPDGTEAKFEPIDIRAGRVKITLRQVHKSMDTLEKRYPNGKAPAAAVKRYNGLVKREHKLVKAYNEAVDAHNAIISSDCDPA